MKTVTEIAKTFDISTDSVRHYTKLNLLTPIRDEINGYRRYRVADEERLRFLLSAKRLGFSLKEIRDIFDKAFSGDTACPLVRELIDRKLVEVREQIKDSQMLLRRMEIASLNWNRLPDQSPSGESICHLIENWDVLDISENQKASSVVSE